MIFNFFVLVKILSLIFLYKQPKKVTKKKTAVKEEDQK